MLSRLEKTFRSKRQEQSSRRKLPQTANQVDKSADLPEIELDLAYYRSRYTDLADKSDEELKAHWQQYGHKEGRFASERHAQGDPEFVSENNPEAAVELDTSFYYAHHVDLRDAGINDEDALRNHYARFGQQEGRLATLSDWLHEQRLPNSFIPRGMTLGQIVRRNAIEGIEITLVQVYDVFLGKPEVPVAFCDTPEQNARHYLQVAKHYLQSGRKDPARALLETACSFQSNASVLELLGNIYLEDGHYRIALGYYNAARALPEPPRWLAINRATCLARLHQYEKALSSLAEGVEAYPDFTQQLDKLDEFAEAAWNEVYPALLSYIDQGDRQQLIDACNAFTDNLYKAYLRAAGCRSNPTPLASLNLNRVLIVGDYHVKQCERYRINQKVEQLEAVGREATAIDWTTLEQHAEALATHDVVIFYRVPAVPKVLKAMAQTNAAGKLSLYEIDDLLVDPIYPPPLASFGGYVSVATHRELTRGMALFRAAARCCRLGIASTEPLRERLAELVFGGQCLLHRNGLDNLNTFSQPPESPKKTLDIFYGSGTQAHNQDFIELALPAIRKLLKRHAHLRLVIVGYLKLPTDFAEEFESQLSLMPPLKSVESYWSLLRRADINLAVLHDDPINACKSELKWFEAACFGVPSVLSSTRNYRDVIKDGEDAYLVSTAAEWERAITKLVEQPELRRSMAHKAQLRTQAEYALPVLGKSLMDQLASAAESLMPKASVIQDDEGLPQVQRTRRKVALVNVFFPPQSIGGATRVVADNFKALRQHYGDDFELVIFTADSECRTPHQLSVYHHNGVRVYRATTLFREHMDWHPKDDPMHELFTEFLECEQPDLVHFHCVQRLTGSVVEAARDAKVPYIITAHDAWWISDFQFLVDHEGTVYPEGHPDPFAPLSMPPGISVEASVERKLYLKGLLADARKVLTVSNAFADIYRKNDITEIEVTPNGISDDLPWAPKDTSYTPNIVGGHVGGMAEHKGYFLLKQAVLEAQPENMEFLVVDHSKEEGYESREYWGKVPVRFIGRVNQDKIVDLYRQIDVLFAPSTWPESFGLVTREAAACGCWIVASNLGGIGEGLSSTSGIVITPNTRGLKKALSVAMKYKKPSEMRYIYSSSASIKNLIYYYTFHKGYLE